MKERFLKGVLINEENRVLAKTAGRLDRRFGEITLFVKEAAFSWSEEEGSLAFRTKKGAVINLSSRVMVFKTASANHPFAQIIR